MNMASDWKTDLVERYGQEAADKIWYEFNRIEGDYECVDNFRACDAYDSEDVRRYKQRQEDGCCGSADFQIMHGDNIYWFGFNHGH